LFVLSIEGLGIGRSAPLPARIVRWVTPPASKRTPPARAAKQLVPARPLMFGFALLRRARALPPNGQALQNIDFLQPLALLTRTVSCVRGEWKERTRKVAAPDLTCVDLLVSIVLGCASHADACEWIASRTSVRALLASEAGRAARAAVAQQRSEKAPRVFRICIRTLRCLTFEVRGGLRVRARRPLDRGVRPTRGRGGENRAHNQQRKQGWRPWPSARRRSDGDFLHWLFAG